MCDLVIDKRSDSVGGVIVLSDYCTPGLNVISETFKQYINTLRCSKTFLPSGRMSPLFLSDSPVMLSFLSEKFFPLYPFYYTEECRIDPGHPTRGEITETRTSYHDFIWCPFRSPSESDSGRDFSPLSIAPWVPWSTPGGRYSHVSGLVTLLSRTHDLFVYRYSETLLSSGTRPPSTRL